MKNRYKLILTTLLLFACSFQTQAAQDDCKVGFINMKACIEKSKIGKKEKIAFENLKKQLGENLSKTDKEMGELAKKLEDQDFVDSLSPAAEEEMKQKFQRLSQEFVRYQNQYYQLINQANYKLLQELHQSISKASDRVREKLKLSFILNDDSAFSFAPSSDVTDEVVKEMDSRFEHENKEEKKS